MKNILTFFSFILVLIISPHAFSDSFKDASTGLTFPATLGSMQQKEVTDFEKQNPSSGLGVGILYRDPNPKIYADIYVYNLGLKDIPNGSISKIVQEQWKQAEQDIYTIQKQGKLQEVKKLNETTSSLTSSNAGPTALRTDFSYIQNGEEKLSHLLLTGYKNNFIKIRFTYPSRLKGEGEKALDGFVTGMGKLLSK